ncbi:MAG TPA: hypothetical protein VL068_14670 [Microthrixaceae bacterium]|nr:hypothetical protein [Microthrixaceae bacterium]
MQRHFATYTDTRTHLRRAFDAAESGLTVIAERDDVRFVLVEAQNLRPLLAQACISNAEVVAEGGGWSAFLPGVPVSGEGSDLDEATDDLIDALRDYADDWNDHLSDAPNHAQHRALVTFVELSSDDELRAWISAPVPTGAQ